MKINFQNDLKNNWKDLNNKKRKKSIPRKQRLENIKDQTNLNQKQISSSNYLIFKFKWNFLFTFFITFIFVKKKYCFSIFFFFHCFFFQEIILGKYSLNESENIFNFISIFPKSKTQKWILKKKEEKKILTFVFFSSKKVA